MREWTRAARAVVAMAGVAGCGGDSASDDDAGIGGGDGSGREHEPVVCASYGGQALFVDGDDGLLTQVGYHMPGPPLGLTVELWLTPNAFPSVGGEGRILDWTQVADSEQDPHGARAYWVLDVTADGRLQFESRAASTNPDDEPVPGHAIPTAPLPLDTWTHVALVIDGAASEVRFYLDGVAVGVATPEPAWWTTGMTAYHRLYIGGRGHLRWRGGIDDVRFWEHARTQAQIRADVCARYTAETAPSGLVEQFAFDGEEGDPLSGTSVHLEGEPQTTNRP